MARLRRGETLGDRIMKVDYAGEHGAICIYRAQRWIARWRAPGMVAELDHFLVHERRHRALFGAELERRNRSRWGGYLWCGVGGMALGAFTGLAGRNAIAATTLAIEGVVLRHMHQQVEALDGSDPEAVAMLREIIGDEQEHYDLSAARLARRDFWSMVLNPVVSASTEAVIWLGMRL